MCISNIKFISALFQKQLHFNHDPFFQFKNNLFYAAVLCCLQFEF